MNDMNMLTTILLTETQATAGGDWSSTLIMFAVLIGIFYFFMIRPQNKERKRMRDFLASLESGVKVKTISGVYGKIKEIKDNVVILEIADNVKIKVDKASIVAPADADKVAESK